MLKYVHIKWYDLVNIFNLLAPQILYRLYTFALCYDLRKLPNNVTAFCISYIY